jgi:hypothetical protein
MPDLTIKDVDLTGPMRDALRKMASSDDGVVTFGPQTGRSRQTAYALSRRKLAEYLGAHPRIRVLDRYRLTDKGKAVCKLHGWR